MGLYGERFHEYARRRISGDVELLLGPEVIGVTLNIWLLGFMMAQCFSYYLSQQTRKDPKWMQRMVLFLLIVDIVNSALMVAMLYDYTVLQFGNTTSIQVASWMFYVDPTFTVVTSVVVQSFYAWRVRHVTGQRWLLVLILGSAFAQFLCGVGTTIAIAIVTFLTEGHRFQAIIIVWLSLAPLTDSVIALSLVWYLRKNRTGFKATDDFISRIIRLTLQTGFITTVWVILDLIIFLIYPNNLHMLFHIPSAKLYTNSLMSSLNAREYWAQASETLYVASEHDAPKPRTKVQLTTTTVTHRDEMELGTRQTPTSTGAVINIGSINETEDRKVRMNDFDSSEDDRSMTNGLNYGKVHPLGDQ